MDEIRLLRELHRQFAAENRAVRAYVEALNTRLDHPGDWDRSGTERARSEAQARISDLRRFMAHCARDIERGFMSPDPSYLRGRTLAAEAEMAAKTSAWWQDRATKETATFPAEAVAEAEQARIAALPTPAQQQARQLREQADFLCERLVQLDYWKRAVVRSQFPAGAVPIPADPAKDLEFRKLSTQIDALYDRANELDPPSSPINYFQCFICNENAVIGINCEVFLEQTGLKTGVRKICDYCIPFLEEIKDQINSARRVAACQTLHGSMLDRRSTSGGRFQRCYVCGRDCDGDVYRRDVYTGSENRVYAGRSIGFSHGRRSGVRSVCRVCATQIDASVVAHRQHWAYRLDDKVVAIVNQIQTIPQFKKIDRIMNRTFKIGGVLLVVAMLCSFLYSVL